MWQMAKILLEEQESLPRLEKPKQVEVDVKELHELVAKYKE